MAIATIEDYYRSARPLCRAFSQAVGVIARASAGRSLRSLGYCAVALSAATPRKSPNQLSKAPPLLDRTTLCRHQAAAYSCRGIKLQHTLQAWAAVHWAVRTTVAA